MRYTCPTCLGQSIVQRYYFPKLDKKLYMCDECYSSAVDENFEQILLVEEYMDGMQPVGSYWLLCFSKAQPRKLLEKIETRFIPSQLLQMIPETYPHMMDAVSGVFLVTPERAVKLALTLAGEVKWDFKNYYYFLEFDELIDGTIDVERRFQDYPLIFAEEIESVLGEVVDK